MKPGSVYIHHLSPPLNQLYTNRPWGRNVYIFVKYIDVYIDMGNTEFALVYNLYQGMIERANIQVFENYYVEVT